MTAATARVFVSGRTDLWTHDRLQRVYALKADNKSASAIAAELGVSRASVLGVVKRDKDRRAAGRPEPTRRPPPALKLVPAKPLPVPKAPSLPLFQAAWSIPESLHVALIDLEAGQCRWPDGHGGCYCGAQTSRGASFCAGHKRLAYVRVERR